MTRAEIDTDHGAARGMRRAAIVIVIVVAALSIGIATMLAIRWPFTKERVTRDLEHFAASEVRIQHFHKMFFPHPGYEAEALVFSRRSNGREIQIASVAKVTCTAGWLSVLLSQHRVQLLNVEGAHVSILHPMPRAMPFFPEMKDKTTVTTLMANGSVLDIAPRTEGGTALRLRFEKLVLGEVKKQKSISFDIAMQAPILPGRLSVRGRFGPMVKGRIGATQLWGSYELQRADLGPTRTLGGSVSSDGSFRGELARCSVAGHLKIDGFQISSVHHPVQLFGRFETTVNGLNGDVVLRSSTVRYLKTELDASGAIQSEHGEKGKTELIAVRSNGARIEDLLTLFTKSEPPALEGPIDLNANIVLPPEHIQFLRKLQIKGEFRIPQAQFEHAQTQRNVNKLSDRARGQSSKDDEIASQHMPSAFKAQVVTRNGIAFLSNAVFQTPGALASGGGTYNLLTNAIDLKGKLAIQASLSKAAGGVKSLVLLPLDPFFKKGNAGAVLPIQVTGTYSHPKFHVSLRPEH